VLKPYGWLRIAEPSSRWDGEKWGQLAAALAEAGFQVTRSTERDRFVYLEAFKP
jgi:hypothetical protein